MVKLYDSGVYLLNGREIAKKPENSPALVSGDENRKGTMAYKILAAHNTSGNMEKLQIKFDSMASHDITYVGIIQTARASGLDRFPMPYVLTNCHNSLCAVGGTINEDDHVFGLSAARRYGGIYVPAHQAVIHQYMREMMSKAGDMILGSDSHTRYGALGTMAIGEGGPELVKQLLGKTYDIDMPPVIAVYLAGEPVPGVGPQDVALAIIGATFGNGYVKNSIMEFVGDGIEKLSMDFRNGIDVMTTETACLSSIWTTDEKTKEWYSIHGRPEGFRRLAPDKSAYYDGMVYVDLSKIRPMIAMPFHPSNVYKIEDVAENPYDIIREVGKNAEGQLESGRVRFSLADKIKDGILYADQGVIAGCAGGTFENICAASNIIAGRSTGNGEFSLSVYPASQPVFLELLNNNAIRNLMIAGASIRSAFCGPCFGAGDVPANGAFSIRHSTRNFPNREGSRITDGQIASVALMDSRSIAATAINGGMLTPATDVDYSRYIPKYRFSGEVYRNRCYMGFGLPDYETELKFGPNITEWPHMGNLTDDIILKVAAVIMDPVTTTDELIPSGETSSYRSNPLGLAEFTLSRKDPGYVGAAKEIQAAEKSRAATGSSSAGYPEIAPVLDKIREVFPKFNEGNTAVGSVIYAVKPGDGSAREQAASCQKVLGGFANIAGEYATKRYRSNLINWGMLPLRLDGGPSFQKGDYIYIPGIRKAVEEGESEFPAYIANKGMDEITLKMDRLTEDEKKIILAGCLINYYRE